jgi:flagellar protein FliL
MATDAKSKDKNKKAEPDDDNEIEQEEGAENPPRRKLSGKLIVIAVAVLLLLVGGGGAGAYFMGLFGGHEAEEATEEAAPEEPKDLVFYDLPEILVNLNTAGRKSSYLKIKVALELEDPKAVPLLDARMPRIIDNFQVYLRELRIDDLQGSEGMFRIKEELLSRVNTAVKPVIVADVLFKEMLVQ